MGDARAAQGGICRLARYLALLFVVSILLPIAMAYDSVSLIPPGSFVMGDGDATGGAAQHSVELTRAFYLGQHEVTNQEYRDALQWAFNQNLVTVTADSTVQDLNGIPLLWMGSEFCELEFDGAGTFGLRESPAYFAQNAYPQGYDASLHPVLMVTWYGAAAFCNWLSEQEGLTPAYDPQTWTCNDDDPYGAQGYRLPTDAEWEYAAQYDDERIYPWGGEEGSCDLANISVLGGGACVGWTVSVNSLPPAPAALDLYNLGGNAAEWCNDYYEENLGTAPVIDPVGLLIGTGRVQRGASWSPGPWEPRCAFRVSDIPEIGVSWVGFRVARTSRQNAVNLSLPARRYVLLSIPLEFAAGTHLSDLFGSVLGTMGRTSWLAESWVGGTEETNPEVMPGKGYWVAIVDPPTPIIVEGDSLSGAVEIDLDPGWNTVGVSSLVREFQWTDVGVRGDGTLFDFGLAAADYLDGTFYWYEDPTGNYINDTEYAYASSGSSLLNGLGGYVLYAHQACTLIFPDQTTRRLPASAHEIPAKPTWSLQLTAVASDHRTSSIEVGVCAGSRTGADFYDVKKPPSLQTGWWLTVEQTDSEWPAFARVYDSPDETYYEWKILLQGCTGGGELRWEAIPEEPALQLVEQRTGRVVDLGTSLVHRIPSGYDEQVFTLIARHEIHAPRHPQLTFLGPIPCRGELHASFETIVDGPVSLVLYDTAGRKITSLVDEHRRRGHHTASWLDMEREIGPGVYFMRFACRGYSEMRRVLVIR